MPLFDVGSPAYQSVSVGTTATLIWSGTVTALVGSGPTYSNGTLGPLLRDVTVQNAGTSLVVVGQSGVSLTTGVRLGPGQQMTIQNWTAQAGTSSTDLYAIASGPGTTTYNGVAYAGASTVNAGLGTLVSVV